MPRKKGIFYINAFVTYRTQQRCFIRCFIISLSDWEVFKMVYHATPPHAAKLNRIPPAV